MVQSEIIIFSLIISAFLLFFGFFFRKKAIYLALSGGVLLSITGIVMLGSPLTFATGTNTTISQDWTQIDTDLVYTEQNTFINIISGSVIMLLGFISIIGGTLILSEQRETNEQKDIETEFEEED